MDKKLAAIIEWSGLTIEQIRGLVTPATEPETCGECDSFEDCQDGMYALSGCKYTPASQVACDLCGGSGEIVNRKARQMGYTFGHNESPDSLDEHLVSCPKCHGISAAPQVDGLALTVNEMGDLWREMTGDKSTPARVVQFGLEVARAQQAADKAMFTALDRLDRAEVWFWQDDNEDHPESLTCPILINADKFRDVVAEAVKAAHQDEIKFLKALRLGTTSNVSIFTRISYLEARIKEQE